MKKFIILFICAWNAMSGISQNVGIGTDNPQEKLDVNGGIHATHIQLTGTPGLPLIYTKADTVEVLDQQQIFENNYGPDDHPGWQSFTANKSGILSMIQLWHIQSIFTTMKIYQGEGPIGSPLATVAYNIPQSGWGSPLLNIPVVAGQQYTIYLDNMRFWRYMDANPYLGGISSTGTNVDMVFKTFVKCVNSFEVDSLGNLSIPGDIHTSGDVVVGGDIFAEGDINAEGDFSTDGNITLDDGNISLDYGNIILDDGYVGLGTSNPTAKLHLSGSAGRLRIDGGADESESYFSLGGQGVFSVDGINLPGGRFIIRSNGRIGIGIASPQTSFHIRTAETPSTSYGILASGGLGPNAAVEIRGNGGTPYLDFANDETSDFDQRLILDNNDRIRIDGGELYVEDGAVYAMDFLSISDQRLKKDIEEVHFPISKIDEMKVYNYYYNDRDHAYALPDALQTGLMAQEVELVYPHAVITDSEGIKAIDYGKLAPLLLDYIKQLKAENESQIKEFENLKAEIEWIKKQL